jgi:nitrogen-specific signal transduction histidine kinase
LEQLLTNLLLNAIEALSRGGDAAGRSSVAGGQPDSAVAPEVEVLLRESDSGIILEIRDNGDGPSPDVSDTLFDPFVTDKADGTGLGLAVAREIALAHRGDLHWERRGARTCFVVQFPLSDAERKGGSTTDC